MAETPKKHASRPQHTCELWIPYACTKSCGPLAEQNDFETENKYEKRMFSNVISLSILVLKLVLVLQSRDGIFASFVAGQKKKKNHESAYSQYTLSHQTLNIIQHISLT
jgi:hypothetical protein